MFVNALHAADGYKQLSFLVRQCRFRYGSVYASSDSIVHFLLLLGAWPLVKVNVTVRFELANEVRMNSNRVTSRRMRCRSVVRRPWL